MNNLQFQYPISFLFLCALLALGLSLFLYYRDTRWQEKSPLIPILLGIGRFLLIFLLSTLLLSPFLTYFDERTESPLLIFVVDNSESIQLSPKETLDQFRTSVEKWPTEYGDYDLEMLSVGAEVSKFDSLHLKDQQTDLSALKTYLDEQYAGRTIGALVLATDGLYNIGQNPVYTLRETDYPIYTLGLGDTTTRRDANVKQVFHNEIAYLGDRFLIQADIQAEQMTGLSTSVQLLRKQGNQFRVLESKELNFSNPNFFQTVEFTVDADQAGLQQYRVRVNALEDEVSRRNNVQDFYVDVIDGRQKILIAAAMPHPDLTALRQILTQFGNYEIELKILDEKSKNLNPNAYDLLILHQLPSGKANQAVQKELLSNTQPKLFILGGATDMKAFSNAQELLKVNPMKGTANVVDASYHNNFNAFQLDQEIAQQIELFPPLESVFAQYTPVGRLNTLYYQKIGDITSEYPLLSVGDDKGTRLGFLTGEGLWRWRLFDYLDDQEHNTLNSLIDQVIRYISIKEDRRKFKVTPTARLFDENESVQFRAELFNDNYEAVNDVDVSLTVRDENNKDYSFLFSRERDFYKLNAGFLPPGNYSYQAQTTRNGEQLKANGVFSVEEIQLEMYQTQARPELLRTIATNSGGSYLDISDMDHLKELLSEGQNLKDVLYTTARTRSFIDLKWIFWLLFALMALEWISRRWAGTY